MLFIHTHDLVMAGRKSQTRRIVGAFDYGTMAWVRTRKSTTSPAYMRWIAGNTYAVQPARTAKAIGRIRITGIRREDVREISDEDVKAEGFNNKVDFLMTWNLMHDPQAIKSPLGAPVDCSDRPAERYAAWVLEFQLCQK